MRGYLSKIPAGGETPCGSRLGHHRGEHAAREFVNPRGGRAPLLRGTLFVAPFSKRVNPLLRFSCGGRAPSRGRALFVVPFSKRVNVNSIACAPFYSVVLRHPVSELATLRAPQRDLPERMAGVRGRGVDCNLYPPFARQSASDRYRDWCVLRSGGGTPLGKPPGRRGRCQPQKIRSDSTLF